MKSLTAIVMILASQVAAAAAKAADQRKTERVYDTSNNPFLTIRERYGDPFPTCFDGVWHLYTLQNGLGVVRHLTSTDLVRWVEHEPALTGGGIATGIVLRHEGTYYMFYTIGQGAIGLVTSDNPWYFDSKKSKTVAKPDPQFYPGARPFRDVSVFYNEEEKLWWMVFEAHVRGKGAQVGLCKAKRPGGPWKPCPPLYTQPRNPDKFNRFVSCPQIIRHGDAWYLTYLSYGTHVHAADNPSGPWGRRRCQYNSDRMTAGSRSGTDGKRRLLWGFFSVRPTPENPKARRGYGGPLGVGREMVFSHERMIGVRALPELVAEIRKPANNARVFPLLQKISGPWEFDAKKRTITGGGPKGGAVLINLPRDKPDYYFEADVGFGEDKAAVSVTVRGNTAGDGGYRVALRPKDNIFEITEPAGKRRGYLTETHRFGRTANLKIFVCDGQLEAFVDGWSDLSSRVLQRTDSKIILEAEGKNVSFSRPLVHYFKQGAPPGPAPKAAPDIGTVKPDLVVPEMVEHKPAPGVRVRQTTPGYEGTKVHHALYLPTDWKPGGKYPVIVEYAGNKWKSSLGTVEGSKLGYGISAGKGFIWVCMPYLNGSGTANVGTWWGDRGKYQVQPTIDYCKKTVRWVCRRFGGDPEAVILSGFSRGAIACNYVCLHDDEIARLWRAFICYSHYDGVNERWPYPQSGREAALRRLKRLKGRPQFICHETPSAAARARLGLAATRRYIQSTGLEGQFVFMRTGFRNHDDAWVLRPSPARKALRAWAKQVLR